MSSYTITEPHPTVVKNAYTHSGRGGAGNMFRAPVTTSPSGVPSHPAEPPQQTTRFYSGRGGAGNAHAPGERQVMSFDEEYARAQREVTSTTGHVGRGGAGNVFHKERQERKHSSAKSDASSSRRDSSSTNGSIRSGFLGRLSETFSHR